MSLPAADAPLATRWEHAVTLGKRPEAYRLAWSVVLLTPLSAVIFSVLQPEHTAVVVAACVWNVLTALVHIALLWRARTPGAVYGAHVLMQSGLLVSLSFLAAKTPFLGFAAGFAALLIVGPQAGNTWPGRIAAASFVPVPLVFFGANLLLTPGHPPADALPYAFLLLFTAVVGTVLMARKHDVELDAFVARARLAEANAELAASMQRLVRTQGELVRSEKLAVMGQLVAGVAHELNTPLGAISASGETLGRGLPHCVHALPEAVAAMDPVAREGFHRLLERVLARPTGTAALSSREERRTRRTLQGQLEAAGVEAARDRARSLVEAGIVDDIDPLLPLLQDPAADGVLSRVQDVAALVRSAGTIQVAAARASKIVQALKRYAHPGDRSGNAVRASLAENLDTVVTLYGSHLKRGVSVVREYADPGDVEARHEALNQVWTNLVHNALQAMDGQGMLTLRVQAEGEDAVRVEVEDDGPGIPADVRARIFEAFFTTKPAGEGSGLGLSICKDIVQQHGGTLSVESAPGRTVFAVVVPRVAARA